jgi:hypothetical protein
MRRLKFACFAVLAGAMFAAGGAEARVYSLRPTQNFFFANPDEAFGPPKVAIDGDSAIALLDTASGREAVLFQRDAATGNWSQVRTLYSVPASSQLRNELAMDNNTAAIMLDATLRIFERNPSTNQWSESPTAGTPQPAGGIAISDFRILVGRRGCNYDADVHEKSIGSGVWRVSGRIRGAIGECNNHGAHLDIAGNLAMVRNPNSEVRVYRGNGAGLDWTQISSFTPPAGVSLGSGPLSFAGTVAIADGGAIFYDNLNGTWSHGGQLRPLNFANGPGASHPHWRDGAVLTHAQLGYPREDAHVYVHAPPSNDVPGFEHAAELYTPGYTSSSDVSNSVANNLTVIAGSQYFGGENAISFFRLPPAVRAPAAYANDFTSHDPQVWQQTAGSQFARVASGSDYVYRQSSLAGEAQAVYTQSDWPLQQSIEADITPTAVSGADRWVGLAVRYVDANNHYYVTLRSSNRIQLRRKVAGAYVILDDSPLPFSLNTRRHVKLIADDGYIRVEVDGMQRLVATDRTLTQGNVALLTYRARADFDNVYASPTAPYNLAYKDYTDVFDPGRPFTREGGTWDFSELPGSSELAGLSQFSTAGDARAYIGTPTNDQSVEARVRLDTYNSSPQGAWFGLLARFVDARTHYYLTARSTNRLEIRRQVNGVATVLASVPFTATPGRFYDLKLTVLSDELRAYVDGALVAQANDSQIREGQYGIATYRTAATFQRFEVNQP